VKESILWKYLKPELEDWGHFQKISDRFTPGIPDVLGVSFGNGWALELKELKGIRAPRAKFRPGQLDWLEDWDKGGGKSFIISTLGRKVYVHTWEKGGQLEEGIHYTQLDSTAILVFQKTVRNTWKEFITQLMELK